VDAPRIPALALEAMAERVPKGAAFGEELLSRVAPLLEKHGRTNR